MDHALHSDLRQMAYAHYLGSRDLAHGIEHIERVEDNARKIHAAEGGNFNIILASVLYHDAVNPPKNSEAAKTAARDSAVLAMDELATLNFFTGTELLAIGQVIVEHSYKSKLAPSSRESAILQDADRLDTLGEVGLERIAFTAQEMGCGLFVPADPFCETRSPEPPASVIDFVIGRSLTLHSNTDAARRMAKSGKDYMVGFLHAVDELCFAGSHHARIGALRCAHVTNPVPQLAA